MEYCTNQKRIEALEMNDLKAKTGQQIIDSFNKEHLRPVRKFRFEDEELNRRIAYLMVVKSHGGNFVKSSAQNNNFRQQKVFNIETHGVMLLKPINGESEIELQIDDSGLPHLSKTKTKSPMKQRTLRLEVRYDVVNQKNGNIRFQLGGAIGSFDKPHENNGNLLKLVSKKRSAKLFYSKLDEYQSKIRKPGTDGEGKQWINEVIEIDASKDEYTELSDFEFETLCPKTGPISTWTVSGRLLEVLMETQPGDETWRKLCSMNLCNWNMFSEMVAIAFDLRKYKMSDEEKTRIVEKIKLVINDSMTYKEKKMKKREFGKIPYPAFVSEIDHAEISRYFFVKGYASRNTFAKLNDHIVRGEITPKSVSFKTVDKYKQVIQNLSELEEFPKYLHDAELTSIAKMATSCHQAYMIGKHTEAQVVTKGTRKVLI